MEIRTTDYHTGGEPFRIVEEGTLEIPGATVLERREYAEQSNEIAGLLTEVEGTAFRTGEHRFLLDTRDPLGTGFVLR